MPMLSRLSLLSTLVFASLAHAESLPEPIRQLQDKGAVIKGRFDTPGGLKGYAAEYQNSAMALYLTEDGKHVLVGTLFDEQGQDLSAEPLERLVYGPMGEAAADSLFRVTTNTLWGLGGIFDVASDMKIPKHSEDFGQTLGVWGVGSGPYLVLPVLGPSSVRDTAGLVVDYQLDAVSQASNVRVRNSLTTLRAVNVRANLLGAGDVLDQAALDKYSFTREIYQQRRNSLIGNAPVEKEERFDLPEGASTTPAPAPAAK